MSKINNSFENKLDEALAVEEWHLYSNKTTDPKPSNMPIEIAEKIIFENKKN